MLFTFFSKNTLSNDERIIPPIGVGYFVLIFGFGNKSYVDIMTVFKVKNKVKRSSPNGGVIFLSLLNVIAKIFLFCALLLLLSCNKNDAPRILNRTCVTTQHHELIIGNIDVYIKYDATDFNFPGWEDLLEFDTSFTTNSEGFGCIENLPIGKHWVAGLGFDEEIKRAIKGRIFVEVTFENPEINEILYVGEE